MGDPANLEIGWRSALTFAVCLPMAVVAIMLFLRKQERAANTFLALFLIVGVVAQIPQIIGFAGFYDVWPGLTFAPFNVELYAGPLIYLHADRLMLARPLGARKWLLLPGVLQTIYYLWAFLMLGDFRAKWAYNEAFHAVYISPVETVLGVGMLIIAIVLIFQMMARYRIFLNATESAARDFDPVWLRWLMISMTAGGVLFAILELGPLLTGPVSYVDAYPVELALTATIAWLGFLALAQTRQSFPKMPVGGLPLEETRPSAENEQRDWSTEGAELRQQVQAQGWFLEPRLSIRELATRMGTNETYISRALNRGAGVTFNAFVNQMRVAHACQLVEQAEQGFLEIALASGFNSKATFNRVFRDMTGMTPSQYKRLKSSK